MKTRFELTDVIVVGKPEVGCKLLGGEPVSFCEVLVHAGETGSNGAVVKESVVVVEAWGRMATQAEAELCEGDVVTLSGRVRGKKYRDKKGITHYNTVLMLQTIADVRRAADRQEMADEDIPF